MAVVGGVFGGVLLSLSHARQEGVAAMLGGLGVMGGLGVAAHGFLVVVSGQGISCFVSIENHTHASLLSQRKTLELLSGPEGGGRVEKPTATCGGTGAA